jgi:hypothetical protein
MQMGNIFLRAVVLVLAIFSTSFAFAGSNTIVVSGVQTPESVVHDTVADIYLVSNVGPGDPGPISMSICPQSAAGAAV